MKKISLCLASFLLTINCLCQNKEIDSLRQLIPVMTNDTARIGLHLTLAKKFMQIDLQSFKLHTDEAFKLSRKSDDYRLARIYSNIGLSHFYNSQIDSARYYYDKALNVPGIDQDRKTKAAVYANYSMSYLTSDDFDKKVSYNLKAIDLAKEDYREVSLFYYNHAVIYGGRTGLSDKSKKYLRLAYHAGKKGSNDFIEAISLKALAYYCIEEKKLDSAQFFLKEGMKICEKTKSPQICYEINSELGRLYDDTEKHDEANEILLKAKDYASKRGRKYDIMISNVLLAKNEMNRERYGKSILYFQEFEVLFKQESVPEIGVFAYEIWSELSLNMGDYRKSIELLKKSITLKDSIYTAENRAILVETEAKYETEKKNKELAQQQIELQKKKTQYSIMTGIAIFLLVSSLLGWFLYQQRQKRKNQEILSLKREQQVKTLESLMAGEEKERFRIAKELHDGVNGDLSAIKYKLTSMLNHNSTVVNEVVAMIDKSSEQVRAISHNLVPPSLEKFNLREALEDYCTKMNEVHEPPLSYQHIGEHMAISKNNEINIYRIVQELVSNSLKHSGGNKITVQTSLRENTLQITVEDNGKGFDPNKVTSKGIGLSNINSRIAYLKATKDLVTNSHGTSFTIEIDTSKLNDN